MISLHEYSNPFSNDFIYKNLKSKQSNITCTDTFESSIYSINNQLLYYIDELEKIKNKITVKNDNNPNNPTNIMDSISEKYKFVNSNNEDININDYTAITITTDYLDLFNINKGDIAFCKKVNLNEVSKLTFPKVCIFSIPSNSVGYCKESNYYVICKVWDIINVSQSSAIGGKVAELVCTNKFKPVTQDIRYVSSTYLKNEITKSNYISQFTDKQIFKLAIVTDIDKHNHFVVKALPATSIIGVIEYAVDSNKLKME